MSRFQPSVPGRICRKPTTVSTVWSLAALTLSTGLAACGATTEPPQSNLNNGTTDVAPSSSNTTTSTSPTTTAPPASSSPGTSSTSPNTSSAPPATTTAASTTSSATPTSDDDTSSTTSDESGTSDETTSSDTTSAPDGEGSPGCGKPTPLESGRAQIDVDGATREYIIAIPDDYDASKPYRLVFTWHPWGGSAEQVAGSGGRGYYGLQAEADGEAIFVSPDGLDFGGNGKGWGNEGGQDLAFFDAMVERFESELCIDRGRIFSTGFSFGGMMSWALGCGRGDVVRAIAPMAGNTTVSGCLDGDNPVAVMGFHGDDDTVVSIEGGRTGRDEFIERNNCGASKPSDSTYCAGAGSDPCTCTTYDGCDEGYPVTWCEFNGPHTPAPNSAATIWNFFASF